MTACPHLRVSASRGGWLCVSCRAEFIPACPWCSPIHEWPCPTIPRCDEPGCGDEAACGWPEGPAYRRTCGHHMAEGLRRLEPS